jgi:hypothetical protein
MGLKSSQHFSKVKKYFQKKKLLLGPDSSCSIGIELWIWLQLKILTIQMVTKIQSTFFNIQDFFQKNQLLGSDLGS